jgi:hypothetical protein
VGLRARRLHARRALPDAAACAELPAPTADERAREDALIDVVERARQDGSIACAGEAAAPPAAAAWVDPRLFCAARLLAASVAAGQAYGLVDAQGRTTTDRMSLAGFPAGAWAEGYAVRAETAPEAGPPCSRTRSSAAARETGRSPASGRRDRPGLRRTLGAP